jgi:hypothetical protein
LANERRLPPSPTLIIQTKQMVGSALLIFWAHESPKIKSYIIPNVFNGVQIILKQYQILQEREKPEIHQTLVQGVPLLVKIGITVAAEVEIRTSNVPASQ